MTMQLMEVDKQYTVTLETRTGIPDPKKPMNVNVNVLSVKDYNPVTNKALYQLEDITTQEPMEFFMFGNTSLSRVAGVGTWIKGFVVYKQPIRR